MEKLNRLEEMKNTSFEKIRLWIEDRGFDVEDDGIDFCLAYAYTAGWICDDEIDAIYALEEEIDSEIEELKKQVKKRVVKKYERELESAHNKVAPFVSFNKMEIDAAVCWGYRIGIITEQENEIIEKLRDAKGFEAIRLIEALSA